MNTTSREGIEEARQAAIEVLLHNRKGPYQGLPRTAGWGYPEPYTRDLMISLLGIAVSGKSFRNPGKKPNRAWSHPFTGPQ